MYVALIVFACSVLGVENSVLLVNSIAMLKSSVLASHICWYLYNITCAWCGKDIVLSGLAKLASILVLKNSVLAS